MITEGIMRLFASLFDFIAGAGPGVPPPPSWASSPGGALATVFQAAASMGVWFPGGLAVVVLTAIVGLRLFGVGVRIARMVLSLFTGGGGHV